MPIDAGGKRRSYRSVEKIDPELVGISGERDLEAIGHVRHKGVDPHADDVEGPERLPPPRGRRAAPYGRTRLDSQPPRSRPRLLPSSLPSAPSLPVPKGSRSTTKWERSAGSSSMREETASREVPSPPAAMRRYRRSFPPLSRSFLAMNSRVRAAAWPGSSVWASSVGEVTAKGKRFGSRPEHGPARLRGDGRCRFS